MISNFMVPWIAISAAFLGVGVRYAIYKRSKQLPEERLRQKQKLHETEERLKYTIEIFKEKDKKLQEKDEKLEKLSKENAKITAKYHKKLKAAEVKKKNLANYKKKKKDTRSLKKQVEEIVGKGPKWLPHSNSEPTSHTMGKPKGSKAGGRKRPELIHQSIDLFPTQCTTCSYELKDEKTFFVYDKVITEFVRVLDEAGCYQIPKIINIKQNIHRSKCPHCDKWIYPDLGLFKNARFGPGLVGYVIDERIRFSKAYEDIINDMQKLFGGIFSLTPTAIIDWFYKFEEQVYNIYMQLEELVKQEEFLRIDETGLALLGKNWWLWVICSANLVLYRASSGRGHPSIKGLIESFKGTIIADFFRAYEKFNENPHQKCLAHLLSDIIELIVGLQKENECLAKKVQKHQEQIERIKEEKIKGDTGEKKKRGRKPKEAGLTKTQLAKLEIRHTENEKTLEQATKLGTFFKAPFKDTCYNWKKLKSEQIPREDAEEALTKLLESIQKQGINEPDLEKIVNRCEKFSSQRFTYLDHAGMPPDNNLAERNLRKFARQRKTSGDFKSADLIKIYASYLSLYMTCQSNDRDFERLLENILSGDLVDFSEFLLEI